MALGSRDNAGDASPSETSPLLANAYGKTRDGGLTIVPNEPIEEPVGDDGRIGDEEAPEMGQAPNPLMEGLPEVAAKMYILLPAVGIGVSIRMIPSRCYSLTRHTGFPRCVGPDHHRLHLRQDWQRDERS